MEMYVRSPQIIHRVPTIQRILRRPQDFDIITNANITINNIPTTTESKNIWDHILELIQKKIITMDEIVNSINDTNKNVITGFAHMGVRFLNVENRLANVENRLANVENRLANVENRLANVENRLANVENRLANVENRLANVENRLANVENRLANVENQLIKTNNMLEIICAHLNIQIPIDG